MSVLVQRPHQMPGVIVLPRSTSSQQTPRARPAQPQRHHTTNPSQVAPAQVAVLSTTAKASRRQRGQLQQPPASSSPHRSTPNKNDKRRSHQTAHQPTASDNSLPPSNPSPASVSIISGNSSSSATVLASHSPVLSSASPVTNQAIPATPNNTTTTPPRKGGRQQHPSPKSAPNTPTPANSLPVPANRRRARSPRPTQKLPGLNLDELLEDDFSPAKKNNQGGKKAKVSAPATVPEPATWQQAALLKQSHPSGALVPLVDPITAVASHHPSHSNPPSPTRTTPPKGSVFAIANEYGLSHSYTMPNLSTPNRRAGGMHARAPSVPSYSAKPIDALFSGLTVDAAPVTPGPKAGKVQHTRGQSVSSSLPPSTSLHARMAAAASTPPSASRRERTLTGNNAGYIKFAGANFQAAPDTMMFARPAFGGMLARRSGSHSGSSDEEEQDSSADSLSEEEETGVFAF